MSCAHLALKASSAAYWPALGIASNTTYLFMPSVLGRKSQISWLVKQRMGAMILSRATRILYMVVWAALRPTPLVQYRRSLVTSR